MMLYLSVFYSYLLKKIPSFFCNFPRFFTFFEFLKFKMKNIEFTGIPLPVYYRKQKITRFWRNSDGKLNLVHGRREGSI